MEQNMRKELEQALKDFEDRRLWGQIQLDFQKGQLVVIRKQETIKTDEDNNREYRTTRCY
jgi:hypothetical protein